MCAQVYDAVIDGACPQKKPFEVVRCSAHQHVGSQCMSLYNLDTDELICRSCPVYGTQPGRVSWGLLGFLRVSSVWSLLKCLTSSSASPAPSIAPSRVGHLFFGLP